jgi:hypothetical protein
MRVIEVVNVSSIFFADYENQFEEESMLADNEQFKIEV